MKTAPVVFSSNMTEKERNDKREFVFDIMSANEGVEVLFTKEKGHVINIDDVESTTVSQKQLLLQKTVMKN
ncbi:uncharacterized protein LOC112462907 isoform X2 [Temnothorax curvispinosus]|uniref:Uncharacterized protein LOC112462907 isoform X2 n=1 Tax=Temnothorax curvispinosus TaxID=300111 RepID=A0A6J1QQJ4_9HYME|nr:uncharacterized protein LOC112462907 isoform X2 [Temnothorax curvispinosus]